MSRSRAWEYRVLMSAPVEHWALHDRVCGVLFPAAVCDGGAVMGERVGCTVSFWLWCNRTKAARIAARLDAWFDRSGKLTPLEDD